MSQPFFSKWSQLSIWLSVTSQVRFVSFCAMEHWPTSSIVFLGCIGVSYLLWTCAAFCWSKSYYQTNINGLPWLTLWFNAHWVEFPILLLVLDLYEIWDGSPFKPVLRARWPGDDAAGSVSEVQRGKLKNWFSHSSGYFHSVAYGYFHSYSNNIASMCHGLTLCYELLEIFLLVHPNPSSMGDANGLAAAIFVTGKMICV
jgi:hypothetical protein